MERNRVSVGGVGVKSKVKKFSFVCYLNLVHTRMRSQSLAAMSLNTNLPSGGGPTRPDPT